MSPNNLDNHAQIETWNKETTKGKLKMACKDKWNNRHPDCPIDNNHPFYPVKWNYTPPVIGGSLSFPKTVLLKYPIVLEFTKLKLKTAYIIEALQQLYVAQAITPGCIHTKHDHLTTALYKFQMHTISTQQYKNTRSLKSKDTSSLQL